MSDRAVLLMENLEEPQNADPHHTDAIRNFENGDPLGTWIFQTIGGLIGPYLGQCARYMEIPRATVARLAKVARECQREMRWGHGGDVSSVLVRDSPPPPLPALRAHLVAKGQQLLTIHMVAPKAPENSFFHSPCPFCPLCTPTLSLNPTLTLMPTPTLSLLLTLPTNLTLEPNQD